jgi:hypothetical protein
MNFPEKMERAILGVKLKDHIQGVEWILVHWHFTCNSKTPRILAPLIIFQQNIKYKSFRVKKIVSKSGNCSL